MAYALAGNIRIDLTKDPLGTGSDGRPVYLNDIWPSNQEIRDTVKKALTPAMFRKRYSDVFTGPAEWQAVKASQGLTFPWNNQSTYVLNPPFFKTMERAAKPLQEIQGARPLAVLGDSITTDHISPAGSIKEASPAGQFLLSHGVKKADFNQYGTRRGNHEVMMRGTFANVRLRNEMMPGIEGGVTRHLPDDKHMSIYDASMQYQKDGVPLIIVAGKEYGTGSSRDWAAKGTTLLGVKAVIAESFERIHRSNLIGMNVLPLQFKPGESRMTLRLDGTEIFDVVGVTTLQPRAELTVNVQRKDGSKQSFKVDCRVDTEVELEYLKNGGVLQYVIRKLL